MAGTPRESAFMPTVKCSTCGNQVEISLMGEHICSGAPASDPVPPQPAPAPSFFEKLNPLFGSLSPEKPKAAPPKVDTSAGNGAQLAPGQLSPVSPSSGSRSVSPKTPNEHQDTGKPDDFFEPKIANDSPPPQQIRRPGGYGGFGDADGPENHANPPSSPKKQAPSLLDRMNTIARGPFGGNASARNAFPLRNSPEEMNGFPGERTENSRPPRAPRKNGYGGFGPPGKTSGDFDVQPLSPINRADTFPRPSDNSVDAPLRTPSAPGPRPDRLRRPSEPAEDLPPMTSERMRRPSRGPDTSRPPPPRTSLIRPPTTGRDGSNVMPAINLDNEFGSGNPHHKPSESLSSNGSSYSRSAASTQPSSVSSPPRSAAPQPVRKPSDTSNFDSLMSDLQSSMAELKPKELPSITIPPLSVGKDKAFPMSPIGRRPPRPEFGYDPRINPSIQNPRPGRTPSPLASPASPEISAFPSRADDPAIQGGLRDDPAIQDGRPDDPAIQAGSRGPAPPPTTQQAPVPQAAPFAVPRIPSPPPEPTVDQRARSHTRSESTKSTRSQPSPRELTKTRSQSRPRDPAVQSARGDCKSCGEPIKGKSISSADGRLTGRYHKACFVCTTCQNPFSSATFYVLDDKPYCELHYHKLNGSLCRSCGNGIEGEYLEDESAKKHHLGCFRCGDCGIALTDGYFEVSGKAFCEKDAWRRVQQPWMVKNRMGPSAMRQPLGAGPRPGGLGVPGPSSKLGPRPRMEKRLTRLGMM